MAFQLGGEEDGGDLAEVHDINVTPFIDVMLVLLIIFMVAAPLATVDVPVDLPSSNAPTQPRPAKPVFVSVRPDLSLLLGDTPVPAGGLGAALDAATGADKDTRVFLRADKAVPYGDLMEVMNTLRTAGYTQLGLVGVERSGSQPAAPASAAPVPAPGGNNR